MIQVHFAWYLSAPRFQQTPVYKTMVFLGELAAPLFFFTLGVSLFLSVHKRQKSALNHVLRRGAGLIVVGLILINMWQASILHYLGIYSIITFVMLRVSKKIRLCIAAIILISTPFVLFKVGYMSGWEHLGYRLADFWTIRGFMKNLLGSGFFPMFPWLVFPIIGTLAAEYMLEAVQTGRQKRFCLLCAVSGILFVTASLFIQHFTTWKITFYPPTISYMLFFTGCCLALLGLFFLLLDQNAQRSKWIDVSLFIGDVSFSAYLMHIIVGLELFRITGLLNTLPVSMLMAAIAGMLLLIWFVCKISVKHFGAGPFEYLFRLLFFKKEHRTQFKLTG